MDKEIATHINDVPILSNYIPNLPTNKNLRDYSKKLRKAGNYPEVVFWQQVNKSGFHNLDFDRQRIIGNYIVDFYIKSLALVIEIDGTVHNDREDYDAKRDDFLISLGLRVYRISYYSVLHDLGNVILNLERFIIENYGLKSNS
jgi:very-short-patch-repair endonuclease